MSRSADAMAELERKVVRMIKDNGKSGAMKINDLSDRLSEELSRKELLDTTNSLARKGILALFTDQNGNSYWHLQSAVEAKKTKDLTPEERVIYGLIRDSKDRGIFKGLIRNKSQMSDTVITKVITKLEGKGLIKQVKDLKKPTQRTYMLKEIEPNISLTGGVWFADGALDQVLVNVVAQTIEKHIRAKSVPRKQSSNNVDPKHYIPNPIYPPSHTQKLATPASCLAYVVDKGIAPTLKFVVTDILAVMRVLIYDGKVEVVKPNYNMAHAEGWNSDLENGGGGMDSDEELKFRKEKKEIEKARAKKRLDDDEREMDKMLGKRKSTSKKHKRHITDSEDSESDSESEEESSEDERARKKRKRKGKSKDEESESDKRSRRKKRDKEKKRREKEDRDRKRKKKSKKEKKTKKEEPDGGDFSDGSGDELVPIDSLSKKRKKKDDKSSRKKRRHRGSSSESDDTDTGSSSALDLSDSSSGSDSDDIDKPGFPVGNGGVAAPQDKEKGGAEFSVGFNPFDGFNEEEYNLLDDPDVMYRWAVQGISRMGLSEAPCVRCPTFEFCSERGPVNPAGCHYFSDWLETAEIESVPSGLRSVPINGGGRSGF